METIKLIQKAWAEDSKIGMDLAACSADTPKLHAKYMEFLTDAKLKLRQEQNKHNTLLKNKFLWYNKKLSKSELEKLGWEPDPFDGLKILKGDLEYYYNADKDIQGSLERLEYWKQVIENLKEIVDMIKWRHQTIRNIIDWKRFEDGQ